MTPSEQPALVFPISEVTAPPWIPNDVEACLRYYIWFLENNGHVYEEFRNICDDSVQQNPKITLSARFILHMIRWRTELKGDADVFKINDHVSSLFARLYVLERPQYKDKFRNRKSFLDSLTKTEEERLLLAFEPLRENRRRFV